MICAVRWRGERYFVECSPSHLLSLAVKIAEAEHISHIYIYTQIAKTEALGYANAKKVIEVVLAEK
ncbi:MAG: hypothetical protein ABWK05_01225 [Pyrobaculum sp.]